MPSFLNWGSGQPDAAEADCAAITTADGTWSDELCSLDLPLLCEFPMPD